MLVLNEIPPSSVIPQPSSFANISFPLAFLDRLGFLCYVKTAFSLLLTVACFVHANISHAGTLTEKGGVFYYTQQGPLCPGLRLIRLAANRFEIRPGLPKNCTQEFPPKQGLFTLVLGNLPPGPITIGIVDDLDPTLVHPTTVVIPQTTTLPITAIKRDEAGRLTFHINGISGVQYAVERTTDFIIWTPVRAVEPDSDFTETENLSGPVYYRVSISPGPPSPLL